MSKNKSPRLGNNPLEWIGKNSNTLTEEKKVGLIAKDSIKKKTKKEESLEKRETFIIKVDLSEKIKDFSYWERIKQKDALEIIIEEFFKTRNVKKRPE